MPVSKRLDKIGVSPTMKVAAEAKEMLSRGINVIDLSVGEPDFPTPSNIKSAAIDAICRNQTKYTLNQGTTELREAIAGKLKRENGLNYTPSEIIVSAGAKQSIYNSIHALINAGEEAIIPAPYYVSYPEIVSLAYGVPVFVQTHEENGFKVTPGQLRNAITDKTKVLILCNPSNPTGMAYSKKELEVIAGIIEERNIYVISDEIYEKLVYDDFEFASFASANEVMKRKTVVINGLSKSYAMTGWRLGYAAADEKIISAMSKIQSHATSNASSISQAAAVEAFNGPQDHIEIMREEYERRRNYFHHELENIDGISCLKPDGAFYLFPNIKHYFGKSTSVFRIGHSFELAMYLLHEAKVATVPGSGFGTEGYLRISYSTSMENLIEGIKRIKKSLAELS